MSVLAYACFYKQYQIQKNYTKDQAKKKIAKHAVGQPDISEETPGNRKCITGLKLPYEWL